MKDYDDMIGKLTEIALKSETFHKEWVTLEMEASGCSRSEAEKRFTITQKERNRLLTKRSHLRTL